MSMQKKITNMVEDLLVYMDEKIESCPSKSSDPIVHGKTKDFIDFNSAFQIKHFIIDLFKLICPQRIIFYRINFTYNNLINQLYNTVLEHCLFKFSPKQILDFLMAWCLLLDLVRYLKNNHSKLLKNPIMLTVLTYAVEHLNVYRIPFELSLDHDWTIEEYICQSFDWSEHVKCTFYNGFDLSLKCKGTMKINRKNKYIAHYNKVVFDEDDIECILDSLLQKLRT